MIESAAYKSRKYTKSFQNYKSCGSQIFRKKRKRRTKRQTDKRCSKRHRKAKSLAYQRIRDAKSWTRLNGTDLPEDMMPLRHIYDDYAYYPPIVDDFAESGYDGPLHDFKCQGDSDFPRSMIPLNQLNLEAPKLKKNIWKPKAFQYYSYFNEDESNLPELPETILTIIWQFYPLFDFMGFRGVELPQWTAEAWKYEETKAIDIGTLGLGHSLVVGNAWRGPGVFFKAPCKELEKIGGFYEIQRRNAADHNVYENEHSCILEYNGSCWVIRTHGFHMCAFVKDPATDPLKIENPWTICSEDSVTIFEKRPGWGDKELPIFTAALKKVDIEIVSMTRSQNRLRKCKSLIAMYEDSELLFKSSNPEVALHLATIGQYRKFEIRLSNDKSCFYLRFMHFRPLRFQYWFKLSWNDMFDLLYPMEDFEPTGELLGVIGPVYQTSRVIDFLVKGWSNRTNYYSNYY